MKILALALIVATAACSAESKQVPAPAPQPAIESTQDGPKAPLAVRWRPVSDAAGVLQLEAVIHIRAPLRAPVHVELTLPQGLELLSGSLAFDVPMDTPPGDAVTSYVFRYSAVPAENLLVVARSQAATMGVHAKDEYRFGRPAPALVRPEATGPHIKVGDHDLGPGIEIRGEKKP